MPASYRNAAVFDYVVVGAGTAGAVLASRLAGDPGVSVALLEAGGPNRRTLTVPLVSLWVWLRRPSRYCWEDWTVPQPALNERRIWWPAGRIVGGSSAINAMIYSRGHPRSYDRWNAAGAPEWSFDALLPYFRRAEDHEYGASPFHGAGGPLAVSKTRYSHDLARAFVAGCREVGIPGTDDFNGEQPEGVGFFQLTQRRGRRVTTAAYLSRLRHDARLSLYLRTRATRLIFEDGRAAGVEYLAPDGLRVVRAAREVILCAGVVRSPQLLMLSGIGPGDTLRRLGIPVVADSPGVGMNLRDHVRVPVVWNLNRPRPTRFLALMGAGVEYLGTRRGLLTSNVCDAAAIVRLDKNHEVPQVRIACRWRVMPEEAATLVDFEVVLIDPRSHGRMTLMTRDLSDAPAVDPRYLSEPSDLETLARGIELARTIAATPACRRAGVGEEHLPGRGDVSAHIRGLADTAFHPVGTCRLGTDPEAVVDQRLRVVGVDGVRVADASVMPTTVAGNAQAAVVAIAERAADLIRGV